MQPEIHSDPLSQRYGLDRNSISSRGEQSGVEKSPQAIVRKRKLFGYPMKLGSFSEVTQPENRIATEPSVVRSDTFMPDSKNQKSLLQKLLR